MTEHIILCELKLSQKCVSIFANIDGKVKYWNVIDHQSSTIHPCLVHCNVTKLADCMVGKDERNFIYASSNMILLILIRLHSTRYGDRFLKNIYELTL